VTLRDERPAIKLEHTARVTFQTYENENMNRSEFVKKSRDGIKGHLFPYSINRTELLIRVLIIGLCVGAPLRVLNKTSVSKIAALSQEASLMAEAIQAEAPKAEMLDKTIHRMESIRSEVRLNGVLVFISIVLWFAVYILSFWMLFIPRVRSMGHSPILAWLMAVPIVNALFAWVLIFAPPK